jgi:FMN-dependent oxidoreductase (nitrilotriacetate monooxygenase family)
MSQRQMHLVGVLTSGPNAGLWTNPLNENRYLDGEWWAGIAQTMEDARFDTIFFADTLAFYSDASTRKGGDVYLLDPIPLAAHIAAKTENIGIGITISSSFFEPYGIARSTRSLGVLSGGRIAWNIVTSTTDVEAQLFGLPALPRKDDRYARAHEVIDACHHLWSSFPESAYLVDKADETFIDPAELKPVDFRGKYITTSGILTVPPSPQNRPVIMQAGASPAGRDFAARWAEVVFTFQRSREGMLAFRADMNERFAKFGRHPGDAVILPSIQVVVGETTQIAREKRDYMVSLIDADVALARAAMSLGLDVEELRGRTTLDDVPRERGSKAALDVFSEVMAREGLSIVETARRFAFNDLGPELVGTPLEIADSMQEMFETWGVDGFIMNPAVVPGTFEEFARSVVPLLQERGLLRTEYGGNTLRSHLFGQPIPVEYAGHPRSA